MSKVLLIADSSFIRRGFDSFVPEAHEEIICTWYNFVDLIHSKGNFNPINGFERRVRTIRNVLTRIKQKQILICDPYYYILEEMFPEVQYGAVYYRRKNELFDQLDQIIDDPTNISAELKSFLIDESKKYYNIKQDKIKKASRFGKKIKRILNNNLGTTELKPFHFIDASKDLLFGNLLQYSESSEVIENCPILKREAFDFEKYELFIKTYAEFLFDISCDGKSPQLNDNVDALSFLYVTKPRKLLMKDTAWENRISRAGLNHYLRQF